MSLRIVLVLVHPGPVGRRFVECAKVGMHAETASRHRFHKTEAGGFWPYRWKGEYMRLGQSRANDVVRLRAVVGDSRVLFASRKNGFVGFVIFFETIQLK